MIPYLGLVGKRLNEPPTVASLRFLTLRNYEIINACCLLFKATKFWSNLLLNSKFVNLTDTKILEAGY